MWWEPAIRLIIISSGCLSRGSDERQEASKTIERRNQVREGHLPRQTEGSDGGSVTYDRGQERRRLKDEEFIPGEGHTGLG